MQIQAENQPRRTRSAGTVLRWRRLWSRVREFNATQVELHERFLLLNRPWEEQYLHWVHDGTQWRLHGQWEQPDPHSPRGVTRGGWCLGRRGGHPTSNTLPR